VAKGDITTRTVKRKDGTTYEIYQGEYRDRDGKRRFVSDENKHKAQAKLREAMNEVEGWTHAKGHETLQQVASEYVHEMETDANNGLRTRVDVRNVNNGLGRLPDWLMQMKITSFKNSERIKDAIVGMRNGDQPYAKSTLICTGEVLSRVFNFAMVKGYVPRNVMKDFPLKLGKHPKRTNKANPAVAFNVLRVAAEKMLRPHADPVACVNVYAILRIIIATGVRPEEVCGIHVTDIKRFDSPPPDRPNVFGEITFKHRSTHHDDIQPGLKDGSESRVLPVGLKVLQALDAVERVWQGHRHALGPGYKSYTRKKITARRLDFFWNAKGPLERRQHGLVFQNTWGTRCHAANIGGLIRQLVVDAGYVKRHPNGEVMLGANGKPMNAYSAYSFRHMVATHNAGLLPGHVGAHVTGHSEETYFGTYVHMTPEDDIKIAQSLGALENEIEAFGIGATNLQQKLLSG
jgi:integrase